MKIKKFLRPFPTGSILGALLAGFTALLSPRAWPNPPSFGVAAGWTLDSRGIWRGVDLPGGNEPLTEIWLRGTFSVASNQPAAFQIVAQASAAVALSVDERARTADHLEGSFYLRGGIGTSFLLMGGFTWRQALAVPVRFYGSGHGEIGLAGAWLFPRWTPRFSVALDLTPGQEGFYSTWGIDRDFPLGPGAILLAFKAGYHDRALKQRGWGSLDDLARGNVLRALSDLIPSEGVLQAGYRLPLPKDFSLVPHVGLSMLTAWPYFNREPLEVWAGLHVTWRANPRESGLIALRP